MLRVDKQFLTQDGMGDDLEAIEFRRRHGRPETKIIVNSPKPLRAGETLASELAVEPCLRSPVREPRPCPRIVSESDSPNSEFLRDRDHDPPDRLLVMDVVVRVEVRDMNTSVAAPEDLHPQLPLDCDAFDCAEVERPV